MNLVGSMGSHHSAMEGPAYACSSMPSGFGWTLQVDEKCSPQSNSAIRRGEQVAPRAFWDGYDRRGASN